MGDSAVQRGGPRSSRMPSTGVEGRKTRCSTLLRKAYWRQLRHGDECGMMRQPIDQGEGIVGCAMALPCIEMLAATPEILRGLMCELSDEDARWKPAPDRFSVAEVLAHLSHSEGNCYRARLDRFMAEERPELEPDDAQMHLDLYRNADPEDAFDHFEDQRITNVELLRTLDDEAGCRVALHKAAGEITLVNMLHEWALHDLGHIRQIAELVRARKYLAGAGPLSEDYHLTP